MALEVELKTYEENLPDLLAQEGKFVLIRENQVLGVLDTYKDAIQVGYEKCGLTPFLVKRIQAVDQVQYFTRDIAPCRI